MHGVSDGAGGLDDLEPVPGGDMKSPEYRALSPMGRIPLLDDDGWTLAESRAIVHALNAAGAAASFVELASPYGHDSFLLDVPDLNRVVDGFLRAAA